MVVETNGEDLEVERMSLSVLEFFTQFRDGLFKSSYLLLMCVQPDPTFLFHHLLFVQSRRKHNRGGSSRGGACHTIFLGVIPLLCYHDAVGI